MVRLFPLEPDLENIKGFEDRIDHFGRRKLGEKISDLIFDLEHSANILVTGKWGTGKTVFLRMLGAHMLGKGARVVFFDAFKNDYVDDPLAALVAEFLSIPDVARPEAAAVSRFKKAAVSAISAISRSGAKVAVRAATLGIVDVGDLSNVKDSIVKEAEGLFDKSVDAFLERRIQQGAEVDVFKSALSDLISDSDGSPIVIIIDELDRCRPTFSLELMERVKHFFDVDGITFVFGCDWGQMASHVSKRYGGEASSIEYLEKFYHLRYDLVEFDRSNSRSQIVMYISKSLDNFSQIFDGFFDGSQKVDFVQALTCYAQDSSLSLRTLSLSYACLSASMHKGVYIDFYGPRTMAALLLLKITRPADFILVYRGEHGFSEIVEALKIDKESRHYSDLVDEWSELDEIDLRNDGRRPSNPFMQKSTAVGRICAFLSGG